MQIFLAVLLVLGILGTIGGGYVVITMMSNNRQRELELKKMKDAENKIGRYDEFK